MLPLLSFHALVAHRGDGLRPELLALLQRASQPQMRAMKIASLSMRAVLALANTLPLSSLSFGQADIEAMKGRCDTYSFVRGTREHADCFRRLDVQNAQMRCQAIAERGQQVCFREYADLIGGAAMAADCGTVRDEYQQYCQ
jgi:hypothetical protein